MWKAEKLLNVTHLTLAEPSELFPDGRNEREQARTVEQTNKGMERQMTTQVLGGNDLALASYYLMSTFFILLLSEENKHIFTYT